MWKIILAVGLLTLLLCGCETFMAATQTAADQTAAVAEEMKESANPYVSLAGWIAAAVATGAGTILARMRKKHNIADRAMTEAETALFESLAETLVRAIETAKAKEVKVAVKKATKHDPELEAALKAILKELPEKS